MMKRAIFLLLTVLSLGVSAQVITTNPAIPIDSKQVVVTFNSDQGSKGLMGYTGDVYAHTGVITDKSSSDSDWKYVKADWGENIDACKMTRIGNDQYILTISPSIREFYNVPEGETILNLAFVFRSTDGSKQGKDTGGKDIFAKVSEEKLAVSFETPADKSLVALGDDVAVKVNAIMSESLVLFQDGVEVASTTGLSLSHNLVAAGEGKHELKAIASLGAESVTSVISYFVRGEVENEPIPAGVKDGTNIIDATTVTLVLFAPDKEFVFAVGDFNDWEPLSVYQMKKDGDRFWITLTGLDNTKEYAYQYWIDNEVKIADPYTNKVLDPWNDKYIPESIYPNLKPYPEGKTEKIVSVFSTADNTFDWKNNDFTVPKKEDLVVYEVLIRDFTANKDIKTITDTLGYLKRLGVNAIELMPFNEFEGNDSWGYNPSFYFATDKAYGTTNDYKAFVDACHKNGIAVIMDMVLNHSFGQSPFAQMYLDGGKPATNNPWYNREHNMQNPDAQWGFDFNHESVHTQALVDSICSYWMSEFMIDGFRFDFTKGFTNTIYPPSSWASEYDASRIAILKRMSSQVWKRKADALVIFEHLAENREEKELANHGILFWGNHNHAYNEGTMGFNEDGKSDFSWASYQRRGWEQPNVVNYMESHDEERLMYKNIKYGRASSEHSVKHLPTALKRMEMAGAFFFPIPGPKMIWQFGELGYDYSINTCSDGSVSDDCRLASKPVKWNYYNDGDRKHLYQVWTKLIDMKKEEPVFETTDFTMDVEDAVKKIYLNAEGSDVRIVGNFDVQSQGTTVDFSTAGWWYDYFKGDSIEVSDLTRAVEIAPGDFHFYTQKKLKGFVPGTGIHDVPSFESGNMVMPNPFSNKFILQNPVMGDAFAEVYDISGRQILKDIIKASSVEVMTEGWPRGVYVLVVYNNSGRGYMQKIIKK
ncbi:T9SS C-terminal target domain-containing protein [Marinilabiliaceae bacterium JC017]|nr:T9SS C-terminal target domain-containing protein [Marinilabiliaceae bacterium JC017]